MNVRAVSVVTRFHWVDTQHEDEINEASERLSCPSIASYALTAGRNVSVIKVTAKYSNCSLSW